MERLTLDDTLWLTPWVSQLSLIAIGNSAQNLITLHYSRRLYNGRYLPNTSLPPKTDKYNPEDSVSKLVSAHESPKATDQCFGTWTFITSVVRLYAAYNLHLAPMYNVAYWTYVVALGHFASELLYFKSMTLGVPQLFPLCLATIGIIWMPLVKDFYVQA
jgi:hypothetical protein